MQLSLLTAPLAHYSAQFGKASRTSFAFRYLLGEPCVLLLPPNETASSRSRGRVRRPRERQHIYAYSRNPPSAVAGLLEPNIPSHMEMNFRFRTGDTLRALQNIDLR